MMQKILGLLLTVCLFTITSLVSAYNLTVQDNVIIDDIVLKLESLIQTKGDNFRSDLSVKLQSYSNLYMKTKPRVATILLEVSKKIRLTGISQYSLVFTSKSDYQIFDTKISSSQAVAKGTLSLDDLDSAEFGYACYFNPYCINSDLTSKPIVAYGNTTSIYVMVYANRGSCQNILYEIGLDAKVKSTLCLPEKDGVIMFWYPFVSENNTIVGYSRNASKTQEFDDGSYILSYDMNLFDITSAKMKSFSYSPTRKSFGLNDLISFDGTILKAVEDIQETCDIDTPMVVSFDMINQKLLTRETAEDFHGGCSDFFGE